MAFGLKTYLADGTVSVDISDRLTRFIQVIQFNCYPVFDYNQEQVSLFRGSLNIAGLENDGTWFFSSPISSLPTIYSQYILATTVYVNSGQVIVDIIVFWANEARPPYATVRMSLWRA